jgi:hypothetical protein
MSEHDDLIRELESFDIGGDTMVPTPPSEVRRLGDRRRAQRRATVLVAASVVAVLAVGIPLALTRDGDPDGSRNISQTPSSTPTRATVDPVITYPGAGVQVTAIADVSKLDGTTGSFKDFIADAWRDDARTGCATPTITVQKYSSDGFALGGVGGCGGYQALWVTTDAHWQQALATQDEWLCGDLARFDVPDGFAGDCYGPKEVLGPDADYGLRLGMTMDEVRAAGGTVSEASNDGTDFCRTVNPKDVPEVVDENGSTHVVGYLSVDPDRGVVALFAQENQVTPRGIRIGSSVHELKAAYPEATRGGFGSYYVTIDDASRYRFDIEGSSIRDISLVLDGPQGCYE